MAHEAWLARKRKIRDLGEIIIAAADFQLPDARFIEMAGKRFIDALAENESASEQRRRRIGRSEEIDDIAVVKCTYDQAVTGHVDQIIVPHIYLT